MAIIACPSCNSQLKVGEDLLSRKLKCPTCHEVFRAQAAPGPHAEAVRPGPPPRAEATPSGPPRADAVRTGPLPLAPMEEELPEFEVEELTGERDVASDRPKKKKKKKKTKASSSLHEQPERSSLGWWVFGSSGIALTMFILFAVALLARPDNSLKGYAGYLFIMMPISTVIFFVAMYLSSIWFEAIEIGEIHVALVKAFILVFIVNLVSLIPGGFILTLVTWFAGIIVIFRSDPWEARVIIGMNWLLGLGVKMLLFAAIMSWLSHGGGIGDNGRNIPGPDVVDNDDR
jgi:hypothetical protein